MLFGAHISAAGGVQNAPDNAAALGCEVFQFFSRSPQGGPAPKLTDEIVAEFRRRCDVHGLAASYIHAPYYINFGSAQGRIRHSSPKIIREELERGSVLGAAGMMTHLGSGRDLGKAAAVKATIEGLVTTLTGYRGATTLLLENAAGAGEIIGDTLEELAVIFQGITKVLPKAPLGVCIDTCHAFASGYDLRTKSGLDTFLKQFDKLIGREHLALFHLNDSKTSLGSHRDRHEHLGEGELGRAAFVAIATHPKLKKVNGILETPEEAGRVRDLALLKKARGGTTKKKT